MGSFLRRVVAICAALTLSSAAAGVALPIGGSSSTTTTTSNTTATTTLAKGSLKLYLPDLYDVHRDLVTVPGRGVTLKGTVRPYVAGQYVTIHAYLGHHLFKTERAQLQPSRRHTVGHFSARLNSPGVGHVYIYVSHAHTSQQVGFAGHRSFDALDRNVHFGSTGRFVQLIQQRLAALHFYVPQTGVYDGGTGLALDAYHRLLRRGVSQNLDGLTISYLLNGWGEFNVRFPGHGHHAEGDLSNQLLGLIDGKNVELIFPISSGKPSTPTVLGDFHIYRRVPGYLPDGMYYSSFFIGGYAIHGYNPAPDYPASHGCMRLPIADAIPAYNWLNMGDWVDVYY